MRKVKIFDINFIDSNINEVINEIEMGGVMVAPAAPALVEINKNIEYYQALKKSDIAIFDSGFLCILLYCIKGIRVKKISGLMFLRHFFSNLENISHSKIFLIDPSIKESYDNKMLLASYNYIINEEYQYIAPNYKISNIKDQKLLSIINKIKPKYIIINLGGGTQEILAIFLKENLSYSPSIICTGAAISFLTGNQSKIPYIVDRVYLGWLYRCIWDYKRFVPRYLGGLRLFNMILTSKIIEESSS